MALVADIGLYRKLTIKPNGEPTCDALEKAEKDKNHIQKCSKEDYAPEPEGNVKGSKHSTKLFFHV